ncbi:hypothetical protein GCM10011409_12160 [Lentibacillus populi]|uniref:Lipoprotein n=1 Tax=Lentibacillus populi TaxID=1827502 RepID=A0A9W5TVQ5_9BACI|nr:MULTISPECIES: PCYCGC domain-containing protein [Bacillaceae]GGB36299.1 hypothetical protein GCM10011409_12160 [Lentibacillus populi]
MKKFMFLFLVLLVALVACSNDKAISEQQDQTSGELHVDQSLDGLSYNMEKEAWSETMVQFFGEVDDPRVKGAYELAINHSDVLDYMPCYCGCYDSNGHESNTDCFVDKFNGKIAELDSMGFSCGICIDIAKTAVAKYKDGESLKDIRKLIDDTFGGNGIGPTPTPMPAG